jgi:peroxiredoxin Q/BCP
MLKEGDKAPDFTVVDNNGQKVTLKDFKGRNIVLYFFPKANTPGCTMETCEFRDHYQTVRRRGTVILGMSADSPKAQSSFATKYSISFPLLCDEGKEVLKTYGVWKEKSLYGRKFMGIERTTFIIDKAGKIKKIFPKVKVKGHAAEVLRELGQK